MKRLFPLSVLLVIVVGLQAQDQVDALRYSQTFPGGTARSVAMGGAFGALGGDFASATINPAGMGLYRKSELTYTPEFYLTDVNSTYNGSKASDSRLNLNANNFGFVSAIELKSGKWKWASFGVGYNKVQNFSNTISIKGNNPYTSLADVYAESANLGFDNSPVELNDLLPYSEGLFYDGGLMYQTEYGNYLINDSIAGQGTLEQSNHIQQRGKMNEWAFSFACNYDHWLYLGATFSITSLWYDETSMFSENSLAYNYQHFKFTETRDVKGTGYSGILGAIVKPIHPLRIGLSYHLPTSYIIEEQYDAELSSFYSEYSPVYPVDGNSGAELDFGESFYRVITPGKAVGSVGLILGKNLLLSTDVEYMDYSKARIYWSYQSDDDYDYSYENGIIDSIYHGTFNVKTGAELRFNDFYLRGGFGYFGSPYADKQPNVNAYQLSYSGGFGFRGEDRFIDFAFYNKFYSEDYVLYQGIYVPPSVADINYKALKLMMTIGVKF